VFLAWGLVTRTTAKTIEISSFGFYRKALLKYIPILEF
jgi:hypothetical protein